LSIGGRTFPVDIPWRGFHTLPAWKDATPVPGFGPWPSGAGAPFLTTKLPQPQQTMPTAIVLLKIDHQKVTGTAEKLLDMRDITELYSVSGRYDLMAIIKCDSLDKIECVITDHLLKTEGIVDSETMFAFRSYEKREGGKAIDVE
jgi:DNA-binding Lrp family transcriptional regulator